MKHHALFAAIGAGLSAAACIVVPVRVEGYDADCRIVTHHMELKTVQIVDGAQGPFICQQGCVDLVVAAGVAAASVVVSGSIVVVGNVVYWAEQRADCQMRL